MGLTGLEPVTPALSRRCSNQLSYRPAVTDLLYKPYRSIPMEVRRLELLTSSLQS